MKNILFVIVAALIFAACKKDKKEEISLPPHYRIQNNTPFQIESAVIKLGNSTNSYPAINAGDISEFKEFSDSDHPNIKLRINNKDIEFTIQPFEGGNSKESAKNVKSTCVISYNAAADTYGVHFVGS